MLGNKENQCVPLLNVTHVLETLEPRLLLTTLYPGDDFCFRNYGGGLTRVSMTGTSGAIELMTLSPQGQPMDIPGIFRSGGSVGGGLAGPTYQLNTNFPIWTNPPSVSVLTLAADPLTGDMYAYDNVRFSLVDIDPTTGQPTSVTRVEDAGQPAWSFMLTALDAEGGDVYGIGNLVDTTNPPNLANVPPVGPFLVKIDPTNIDPKTGAIEGVVVENPIQPVLAGVVFNDLTYFNNMFYALSPTTIYQVDPATGLAGPNMPITDPTGAVLAGPFMGITNVNGQFYLGTAAGIYSLNIGTGVATVIPGQLTPGNLTDLASDGTNLYGMFSDATGTAVGIINTNPPLPSSITTIYIASASPDVVISTGDVAELDGLPLWDQADPFGGTVATLGWNGTTVITAPGSSGGSGVGIEMTPNPTAPTTLVGLAADSGAVITYTASPLGVYPGGELWAGVMSAGPIGTALGSDTTSVPGLLNGLGQSVGDVSANSLGEFFAVDNITHQLTQTVLVPATPNTPTETQTTNVGMVVDAAQPNFRYDNIQAMDFNSTDQLYAVATMTNLVTNTPVAGTWLITIDTTTGEATRVVQLVNPGNITAISFSGPTLYAFNNDSHYLETINQATGALMAVQPVRYADGSNPDIQGMDWQTGGGGLGVTLYAVGRDGVLMTIDVASGQATPLQDSTNTVGGAELPQVDMTGVTFTTDDVKHLYGVSYVNNAYRLIRLDPTQRSVDIHRLLIGGTLAGRVQLSGSVDVLEYGFMWGSIDIAHDANYIIDRTDVVRDPTLTGEDYLEPNDLADVTVGGTLGEFKVYGSVWGGSVDVQGADNIPLPESGMVDLNNQVLTELEYKVDTTTLDRYAPWFDGELVFDYNDDAGNAAYYAQPQNAQFLSNSTGHIVLQGSLGGVNYVDPTEDDPRDYYAIALMAGQTITLDGYMGHVTSPGGESMYDGGIGIAVQDEQNNYMASVGLETVEDMGPDSMGSTQKALTFTAPKAGIYYLIVATDNNTALNPDTGTDAAGTQADYTMFIDGSTRASLGQVNVTGLVEGLGQMPDSGDQIHVERGTLASINVGGVMIDSYVKTEKGGDIVASEFGDFGYLASLAEPYQPSYLIATGSIGSVWTRSSTGKLNGDIIAGADMGQYNNNAVIQNVLTVGTLNFYDGPAWVSRANPNVGITGLWSSGSIGSVRIGGSVNDQGGTVDFVINGDDREDGGNYGPFAYLDLLAVGGDWDGALLMHGPNADVRMVTVQGVIAYGISASVPPTTVSDGSSTHITDDGGGQFTITPGYLTGTNGQYLTTPDAYGHPAPTSTTYTYTPIPVYDYVTAGYERGEVLESLTTNGPATITLTKPGDVVDIGYLTLTMTAPVTTTGTGGTTGTGTTTTPGTGATGTTTPAVGPGGAVTLNGSGSINVYYVKGTAVQDFINNTNGDIVSGAFDGLRLLSVKGNVGHIIGHSGQMIVGNDPTPDPTWASWAGWVDRRINGLNFTGDVATIRVGGYIGDLLSQNNAINSITANADHYTAPNGFDGIVGVIHAATLGTINTGDGLADDGSGDRAMAAIMSDGTIGSVTVSGTQVSANPIAGSSGVEKGVLNGYIGSLADINSVSATGGSMITSLIVCGDLDTFKDYKGSLTVSGTVGKVSATGVGSIISGCGIAARDITSVIATAETGGIISSYFSANAANPNSTTIGSIQAGGPGLLSSIISTNGGPTGIIRGLGPLADILNNTIDAESDGPQEISGRDVAGNEISAGGTIGSLSASRDMYGNTDVTAGAITNLRVGGSFMGNTFHVADSINSAVVNGIFSDSVLDLQGINSRLYSLTVGGNITGEIRSAGSIGSITSRKGAISASITVVPAGDVSGTTSASGNVDSISALTGFTGTLDVAGNLGKLITGSQLGVDPSLLSTHIPLQITVGGNIGQIQVNSAPGGSPVNLYSMIHAGGNVGSIQVAGALLADVFVNGNLGSLKLSGDMGGDFVLPNQTLGNVTVMGTLGSLSLPSGASIIGDLTTGGTIGQITLNDNTGSLAAGNIYGNITSLYGSIAGIYLTNGQIEGDITAARDIGNITLKGTAADPADVLGSILAQAGSIGTISITGGDLNSDVAATSGQIAGIQIKGGTFAAGHSVTALGAIGTVKIATGGADIGGDFTAGAGMGTVAIGGGAYTGAITSTGNVGAMTFGQVNNDNIWVDGQIGMFSAGGLNGVNLGSLLGVGTVNVTGDVTNSQVVGGYHMDGATKELHSANIGKFQVGGNWTASVVALGIDPGAGNFLTPADNTAAPGLSSLGQLTVKGTVNAANSLVVADTSTGITPDGMPANTVDTAQPPLLGVLLNQGINTFGPLVITFKDPTFGQASYDANTRTVWLNYTSDKTSLSAFSIGGGQTLNIQGGDDDSLGSLTLMGDLMLGNVNLDGRIGTASLGTDDSIDNPTWAVWGGIGKMTTAAVSNLTLETADLGSWTLLGDLTGGQFSADVVGTLTVNGSTDTPLTIGYGGIGNLKVAGAANGTVWSKGTIGGFTSGGVGNQASITVTNGNLNSLSVNGDLLASVDVQQGSIGTVKVTNGSYSTPVNPNAIRSLTGIGQVSVTNGDLSGLISTDGPLGGISVTKGTMRGRVRAYGINSVNVDALDNALISSGANIGTVNVKGDATDSNIVSGLDTGDAGWSSLSGEDANVMLDGQTPANWRTPGNADVLTGGNIGTVNIGGDLIRTSIAASISPGIGGYFGTGNGQLHDDQTRGAGTIGSVKVHGVIDGGGTYGQHYAIMAASGMPKVSARQIGLSSSFSIENLSTGSGSPRVTDVVVYDNRIVIYFDHDLDFSTISANSVHLVISRDGVFNGGPTDLDVTGTLPTGFSYDVATCSVTLTLTDPSYSTFESLGAGVNYMLTLDGTTIADTRGNLLDGEYTNGTFPSGDGFAGGNFVYHFLLGSPGDTDSTAADLTPIIQYNQDFTINGDINSASDVNVYRLQVHQGDILYGNLNGANVDLTTTAPTQVTNGNGTRFLADGVVYIEISSAYIGEGQTGPYALDLLLFNDGNSNFSDVDPTQTPTPLTWVGNTAEPSSDQEVISALDDADVYNLGTLQAGTRLDLSLDTILIGSKLHAEMAVFDSNDNLVGSLMSQPDTTGMTDVGSLQSATTTLKGWTVVPTTGTYYVVVEPDAVASDGYLPQYDPSDPTYQQDVGKYRLTINKTPNMALTFPKQVVYVDMTGGYATYLAQASSNQIATYQPAMNAADFGFDATQTQNLMNQVLSTIEANYAQLPGGDSNIQFTTIKPQSGSYSTLFIGDGTASSGLLGLGQSIDEWNQNPSDNATVFGGDVAEFYNASDYSLQVVGTVLGNIGSHELGHILGLNHVNNTGDPMWIMAYNTPGSLADYTKAMQWGTHVPLMTDAHYESLVGFEDCQAYLQEVIG